MLCSSRPGAPHHRLFPRPNPPCGTALQHGGPVLQVPLMQWREKTEISDGEEKTGGSEESKLTSQWTASERDTTPKMKIVLIYSPSCHSKMLCISFFWQTLIILKNVGNQTIEFHCDILRNVIFYDLQKKEMYLYFWVNYTYKLVVWGIVYNHTSSIFNTGAITVSCIGNSLINTLFD